MIIWWQITFFDSTTNSYHGVFDNRMVPFKFLPHLKDLSIKSGHLFDTDDFKIEIPGANLWLHMPTKSLWVDDKPYYIQDGTRVILFERNIHQSDGHSYKIAHLGLVNEAGDGTMAKYNMQTGEMVVKRINANVPNQFIDLRDEPILTKAEA